MEEKKYLAKNIGIITVSKLSSRMLAFFLVPLYTNILTTLEYGLYDLLYSTICFIAPIITLSISDSTLRFALDKDSDNDGILTVSVRGFLVGFAELAILVGINYYFVFSKTLYEYSVFFLLMYIGYALSGIIINFSRGIDKVKEVGISGVLSSIVMLGLNILFLLYLKMGLRGFFLANIIAPFIQILFLTISLRLWRYIKLSRSYESLRKKMLAYSTPLIANTTSWWVINLSDRYIVTLICGVESNGVYSIAYKIPSILTALQGFFNEAWTLSAVKDYDADDSKGFFKDTYNIFNFSMVIICSLIILSTRLFARVMYAKEFYDAWLFVPWLTISVVFGALSGYLGGIFAAVKETKVFAQTTIISAGVNIILNLVLVYFVGPIGAAISTLISYLFVFIIRLRISRKYIDISLNIFRDCISYVILIVQAITICFSDQKTTTIVIVEFLLLCVLLLTFRSEFDRCIMMLKRRKKKDGR